MQIQNHYFLVRHSESENNVLGIESSQLKNKDQFGLSNNGKKYAEEEASKYKDFDIIFSSPFRRARETASFFARTSNCRTIIDERIREVDVGDFELQNYEQVETFYKENSDVIPCPHGESLDHARIRTIEFIEEINKSFSGQKILIVAHGYNVHQILKHLIDGFDWHQYQKTHDGGRRVFSIAS